MTNASGAWQEFNRTETRFDRERGLLSLVADTVEAYPEHVAVRTPDQSLTYRELDQAADAVADFLVRSGVRPGSVVAVTASRTVFPYAAILGTLRAGCCYLPIDATDPEHRLRFMLVDAQAAAILARAAERPLFDWLPDTVHARALLGVAESPSAAWQPIEVPVPRAPTANRRTVSGPAGTCYVIYTSGTTGTPKGVRIGEASLLNFVHWFVRCHQVTPTDRVAQAAPLTFDPSVQQIFPAWVRGACLLPVPTAELYDPSALLTWLAEERITHVDAVTAQWHHWRQTAVAEPELRDLPELRWVIVGGETTYYRDTHEWYRTIRSPALLNNVYGPTEATVDATATVIEPDRRDGQVPIGPPLPNYRLYVVDEQDRLCPPYVTGELLIAGDGLAEGYQSAAATGERFVRLTLPDGTVERVYRSGDLARLIDDPRTGWTLEFIGRMDTQVKIRGFRIELEEVEAAARECPEVVDVAVQLRNTTSAQLVCCYVARGELPVQRLRTHLASRLAAHAVPNLYLRVPVFPVTRNGKLDRDRLAVQLEEHLSDRRPPSAPPRTPTEELVAASWAAVLGLGNISVDENFFELGGTSLLAVTAVTRLRQHGLRVLPTDLMRHPTVATLVAHFSADPRDRPPGDS